MILTCIFIILTSLQFCDAQELVYDIYPGTDASNPHDFIRLGEKTIFIANSPNHGIELWSTDGNSDNSFMIKDIDGAPSSSIFYYSTNFSFKNRCAILNDDLYFFADDGISEGLWKTNGTTQGTSLVSYFPGKRCYAMESNGNKVCFLTEDTFPLINNSGEAWISDGTSVGTQLIKDSIYSLNYPKGLNAADGNFYFTTDSASNVKLWLIDGATNGTSIVKTNFSGAGLYSGTSELSHYITYNNKYFFAARHSAELGTNNIAIWSTDGTTAGTIPLKIVDNNLYSGFMTSGSVIEFGGLLYFLFIQDNDFDAEYKVAVWVSDGTVNGTENILVVENDASFIQSGIIETNGKLMLTIPSTDDSTELILFDPDSHNYTPINKFPPPVFANISDCSFAKNNSGQMLISYYMVSNSGSVLHYDSSNNQFQTISPKPCANNADYCKMIALDESFIYSGFDAATGSELWIYPHVISGTHEMENISGTELKVYPNPASNVVTVSLQLQNMQTSVAIISIAGILGQTVFSKEVTLINGKLEDKITLNEALAGGLYFVKVDFDSNEVTHLLMVKK